MLLHIDMDAFFASVEQQINPNLKGKPVIVGSRDKKYYTVVAAASYEAKAYGIDSGMLTKDAYKLCPHAEFVACDSAKYTYVSREIFTILQDYSPQVEHSTIDEFDLEITGLERLFGPPLELGKIIKKRIRQAFGLTCSIGIAPTWILAKLGTKIRKPDGLILINEANLDTMIQGLPVSKICGIGPAINRYLETLGIQTCDQLKTIPEPVLVDNFGRSLGQWLYHILRFEKDLSYDHSVNYKPSATSYKLQAISNKPRTVGHSYTLPRAIFDQKIIDAWLRMLCEMVAERLRKYELLGHTTCLWVNSRNESFLRQKTHPIPTNDGLEIFLRSRAILAHLKANLGAIRALGVSLSGLISEQSPPLLTEQKKREDLLKALDKINARYGDWTISPAVLNLTGPIKE